MDGALEAAIASGKIPQRLAAAVISGKYTLHFLLEDDSRRLFNVVAAFATLEVFFVSLFYYSRLRFRTTAKLDLWLMIPAFLFGFSQLVLCICWVRYAGLGRHIQILSPTQITLFLKLQIVLSLLNASANCLPRLCILCLYLRVFQERKPYRYATYFIAAFLIAHWIAHVSLQFALCTPFKKQWNPMMKGHCINAYKVFIWSGFPTIVADVMIIALPLPLIWRLQTSIGQKVGLTVTFLMGSIGIVTGIIRFVIYFRLLNPSDVDFSWIGVDVIMWGTIEPSMYLVSACLPALRPLVNATYKNHRGQLSRIREKTLFGRALSKRQLKQHDNRPARAVTIALADPTIGKGRFNKLENAGDEGWPIDFSGNHGALVTCFRESREFDEGSRKGVKMAKNGKVREREDWGALNGIVVQKEYSVSTEPVVVDTGREYVVNK